MTIESPLSETDNVLDKVRKFVHGIGWVMLSDNQCNRTLSLVRLRKKLKGMATKHMSVMYIDEIKIVARLATKRPDTIFRISEKCTSSRDKSDIKNTYMKQSRNANNAI